jgi:hypothetical protein
MLHLKGRETWRGRSWKPDLEVENRNTVERFWWPDPLAIDNREHWHCAISMPMDFILSDYSGLQLQVFTTGKPRISFPPTRTIPGCGFERKLKSSWLIPSKSAKNLCPTSARPLTPLLIMTRLQVAERRPGQPHKDAVETISDLW